MLFQVSKSFKNVVARTYTKKYFHYREKITMSNFTADEAIQAGLVTELMTVVTDEEVTPTKLSGTYKLDRKLNSGNFAGYQFVVNQDYLYAESISGTFSSREEIQKFGEEMKNAGVQVNFIDDFPAGVTKYSAIEVIKKDLITSVQEGLTNLQGSFEVSEGKAIFKQKPFQFQDSSYGAFRTIDELAKMIEKFLWLDSLKPAERAENVRRDLNRNEFSYTQSFRDSLLLRRQKKLKMW